MKTTKLIIGLLFLLMLGYTANAQSRSVLNKDTEIYSWRATKIWKVKSTYYISVWHPVYKEILTHNFTLDELRSIYCYSLNYMDGKEYSYKELVYFAEQEHKDDKGKIHFAIGFNSKRKPYTKVELSFYDRDWIHGFSERIPLESLLKWIGEDFKEWRNPDWKDKYCK